MREIMKDDETAVVKVAGALVGVLGAWVALSALLPGLRGGSALTASNLACGVLVAVVAWGRSLGRVRDARIGWLNVVLGIWIAISPALLSTTNVLQRRVTGVAGLLVTFFALWSVLASSGPRRLPAH